MPLSGPSPEAQLLVADDEEGLRYLMIEVLEREGYVVAGVESGAAAVEWLAKHRADLLLLDLKLADMGAPKVVEKLRARGLEVPFIVITGHGDERTAVDIMRQGALDYVMKESGLLDLLPTVVRRALGVVERDRKLQEAHAAIAERERRYQSVIQTALDGFVSFNAAWRITDVNRAVSDLLGYSREELLEMQVVDLDGMMLPPEIEAVFSRLKHQGRERFFTRLRRKDGGLVEVDVSMHADQWHCFCFIHDISEQRRLEREVLAISEDERRRFGRELHDGLGQELTALELMSHTLARKLASTNPEMAGLAEEIAAYTRNAVSQSRRLAHGLAPVRLESEGLMAALNDLAYITDRAGTSCDFKCDAPVTMDDLGIATNLYRIAQEAVCNSLKYAGAKHIVLALKERGANLEMSVSDDGFGFPENKPKRPGMGLEVMGHRARLMGGKLEIESTPGQGVRIVCTVPRPR